ncbi:uncharacterized protein LOC129599548 isoform X2 [Paramacrobiotus metropolitanus]|uniref:uncharacterized protein LOC129599548 isoform X2 n=1 Tax=Paramacrobiotus metropolitanus TaxID=2943436 RepID=UPI002446474F|nr:uncharacterized protein LOC129599548 isoform X2 [Paramacrobiotus metropolitanus]
MEGIQQQLHNILRHLNAENVEAAINVSRLLSRLLDCCTEERIVICLDITAILTSVTAPEYAFIVTALRAIAAALLSPNAKAPKIEADDSIESALRRHECGNHVDRLKAIMAEVDSVMTRLRIDTNDDNGDPPSAQHIATSYNIQTLGHLMTSASYFDRTGTTCAQGEAPMYLSLLKTIALVATHYLLFESLRAGLIAAVHGSPGVREQTAVWKGHLAEALNGMALVDGGKVHFAACYLSSASNAILEGFRQQIGCTNFLQSSAQLLPQKAVYNIVSKTGVDFGDILLHPYPRIFEGQSSNDLDDGIRAASAPLALPFPLKVAAMVAASVFAGSGTGVLAAEILAQNARAAAASAPVPARWRTELAEDGSYKLFPSCSNSAWVAADGRYVVIPETCYGPFIFIQLIDGYTIILDKCTNRDTGMQVHTANSAKSLQ